MARRWAAVTFSTARDTTARTPTTASARSPGLKVVGATGWGLFIRGPRGGVRERGQRAVLAGDGRTNGAARAQSQHAQHLLADGGLDLGRVALDAAHGRLLLLVAKDGRQRCAEGPRNRGPGPA